MRSNQASYNIAVRWKLRRVRRAGRIRMLDLFAGCGGLSLGFHRAGFLPAGAVESDATAAGTYATNFFRTSPSEIRQLHAKPRDIMAVDPVSLAKELGLGPTVPKAIDVLLAGPPCQAYARIGRAKLREVYQDPAAWLRDRRGTLYLRLLDYIHEFRPLGIVVENVPDALNYGGHNIAEELCEVLETMDYVCSYTLLNSVYYGVPQMRERMFLVALHRHVGRSPRFPAPTHWFELPRGYEGSRRVALKTLKAASSSGQRVLSSRACHYVEPPQPSPDLIPAVTAQQAIGDLPPITSHLNGGLKRGPRRFETLVRYDRRRRISSFAEDMRSWPGFENCEGIRDHVIRWLPRDYEIFRRMRPGNQYPEAHQIALALFREKLEALSRGGRTARPGTAAYKLLKQKTVPPYDPGKFPNKWWKTKPNEPVRTLLAHLEKDSYTHIHYDDAQARTISVREAARLQSFPDGFVFKGSMNAAFRQIGNAVPPLLAFTIASEVRKALEGD